MKTVQFLLFALILITVTSCEKDTLILLDKDNQDKDSIPKSDEPPTDEISLTFTVQTQQDQMGDFAENAIVEFNGKVWSVGGVNSYSNPNSTNAVWSSSNGSNWISVTSNLFDERRKHTLTVFDDKMWLIGGVNDLGTYLSDIWYSTDGISWTLATDAPSYGSAAYHSTLVFNDRLYVIKDTAAGVAVWSSSDGVTWVQETPNAFSNREDFEVVVFDGALYVIGGNHLTDKYNEIWKSTDGSNWDQVTTTTIFPKRDSHTATVYNNKVWVIGGFGSTDPILDIWYSEDMENWTSYEALPATEGLYNHAALNYNGEIWLFGGWQQEGTSSLTRIIGEIRSIHED